MVDIDSLPQATTDGRTADLSMRIVRDAPVAILVLDLDGRIEHVNPFFERLTGYRVDEVRGQSWFDAFVPERHREPVRALFTRSGAGDGVRARVSPIVTRAGEERLVAWTDDLLRDGQGAATGVLAIGRDVTDELAAELRDRSVLAAMHDGVVVQSASGEIVECNAAAERMLGLSVDQLQGRTSVDASWRCVHEDDTPFPGETHPAMVTLRTGAPCTDVVMGVHRPDGTLTWISVNAEPLLRPGDGEVVGTVTSFSDITQRKQAEQRLLATEHRLTLVLDNVTDGFFTLDRQWRYVDINPSGARLVGHSPETLVGRAYLEAFPDAAGTTWERTYRQVMHTGVPATVEDYYEPLDQSFEARVFPYTDGISVFFSDISARKRAEAALRAKEAWFRGIFENVNTAIAATDVTGAVTHFNDAFVAMLGYAADELRASKFSDFTHGEDLTRELVFFDEILAGERKHYRIVKRYVCKDGRVIWVDLSVAAIHDESGKLTNFVAVIDDITERMAAEEAARRSLELLRSVLGAAPVVLFALDEHGRFKLSEGRGLAHLGLEPGEVVGRSALELYGSLPGFLESFGRARAGRECRLTVTPDDAVFDTVLAPSYDAHGEIDGVVGVALDVTAGVAAEAAAREGEARFSAVFHGNPIAMGVSRMSDDAIVEANEAFHVLMGVGPGELVGKRLADLRIHDDEAQRKLILEHVARREPVRGVEVKFRTPAGVVREVLLTVSYVRRGGEDFAQATIVDVTEQRLADAALREREARLAVVFHHTSDAMLLLSVDPDGKLRVAAANREYVDRIQRVTEVGENDLIGLTFEELHLDVLATREAVAHHRASLQRVIEMRAPVSFEQTVVFPMAEPLFAEVTLVPVLDGTGACAQVLEISRDITARKQADVRIRAALAEKETLLREIHHRVKNNLQIVSSLLYFQAKKFPRPEDAAVFEQKPVPRGNVVASCLIGHEQVSVDLRQRDVREHDHLVPVARWHRGRRVDGTGRQRDAFEAEKLPRGAPPPGPTPRAARAPSGSAARRRAPGPSRSRAHAGGNRDGRRAVDERAARPAVRSGRGPEPLGNVRGVGSGCVSAPVPHPETKKARTRRALFSAFSAVFYGAGEEIRTLDVHLGKVALYH